MVLAGQDVASSEAGVQLAQERPRFWACVGLHPWVVNGETIAGLAAIIGELGEKTRSPAVVAVSEIGLDHVRCGRETWAAQEEALRAQLALAARLDLPAVVHCRAAYAELLALVQSLPPGERPARLAVHGFSGSLAEAQLCVDLGFYLSFGPAILGDEPGQLLDVLRWLPLDRLLFDSDATGQPGRPVPADLWQVADKVAAIRGLKVEEVAAAEVANACRFFGRALS